MAKATTGVLMGGLSGKAGTVVFVRQPGGGTVLRPRTRPTDPQTPAQRAARARLAQAIRFWKDLSLAEVSAWRTNAETLALPGEVVREMNVFNALALKFLQVSPTGSIPRLPPTSSFTGDGVVVSVSSGSPGKVTFAAGSPNSPDVVTELLLQPVGSVGARPILRSFRPVGFVSFASSSLSYEVDAPKGWVACAIRFVRPSTGQASGLVVLGTVRVS